MLFFSIYKRISKSLYGTGLSKITPVRKIHQALTKKLKPEFIEIFGYKMYLDHGDPYLYCMNDEDAFEIKVLEKYIKKGDIVIDVGANVGFYTLLFASLVGDTGIVHAFEPAPKTFASLKKNVEINNLNNVVLHNKALGSENEKIKLTLSKSGLHNVSKYGDIEVDCVRLDDYVKSANFVKIDAEGYEIEILKGMPNLLHQDITIMSEFYGKLTKRYNKPSEFFDILTREGFNFRDMGNGLGQINVVDLVYNINEETGAVDLLCEKKPKIK